MLAKVSKVENCVGGQRWTLHNFRGYIKVVFQNIKDSFDKVIGELTSMVECAPNAGLLQTRLESLFQRVPTTINRLEQVT